LCPCHAAVHSLIQIDKTICRVIATNPAAQRIAEAHAVFVPTKRETGASAGYEGIVRVFECPGGAAIGCLVQIHGMFVHPRRLARQHKAVGIIEELDETAAEWEFVLNPCATAIGGAIEHVPVQDPASAGICEITSA
jgi:hypothetical protein